MSSSDSLDVDDGGLNTNTNSAADVGSTSEIEDIIWTLLARSGLISQFKGEIAKCLQENSGTILSDSAVSNCTRQKQDDGITTVFHS